MHHHRPGHHDRYHDGSQRQLLDQSQRQRRRPRLPIAGLRNPDHSRRQPHDDRRHDERVRHQDRRRSGDGAGPDPRGEIAGIRRIEGVERRHQRLGGLQLDRQHERQGGRPLHDLGRHRPRRHDARHPARRRLAQLRQQRSPVRRRRRAHPQRKHGDHLRHQLRQRRRPGGLRQRRGRPQSGRHRKRLGAERPLGHRPLRIAGRQRRHRHHHQIGTHGQGLGRDLQRLGIVRTRGFLARLPGRIRRFGRHHVADQPPRIGLGTSGLDDPGRTSGQTADFTLRLRRKVRRLAKTLSLPLEELGHRGIHAPAVGICRRLVYGYFRNRRDLHQLRVGRGIVGKRHQRPILVHRFAQRMDSAQHGLQPPGLCADAEPEAQQAPRPLGEGDLLTEAVRQHAGGRLRRIVGHVRPAVGL